MINCRCYGRSREKSLPLGLEGYADAAIPRPVRRLTNIGSSCLQNETYNLKGAPDTGQRRPEKARGKWQYVAGFSNGSLPFHHPLM
jgi:hypothetical protein